MSRAVWKYDIPMHIAASNRGYETEMPIGAQFRHIAVQYEHTQPHIISTWFEVDPDAAKETRCFRVFGTGHPWDGWQVEYLGTTLHQSGSLVLHLYEDVSS